MKSIAFPIPFRCRWFSPSKGEKGFTLVEMLVVITIIGLIMALVGPRVLGYLNEAKLKAVKIQIETFSSALDLYYLDNGRYPTTSEGLIALVQRPSGSTPAWNGPYLNRREVPVDPWGKAYGYRAPADSAPYEVISSGAGRPIIGAETKAELTNSPQSQQ
jgi:general secretion pathway protein G